MHDGRFRSALGRCSSLIEVLRGLVSFIQF